MALAAGPEKQVGKLVISNIGLMLSGDLDAPLMEADTVVAEEGRITAVADVFDALSSKRPYKPPFPCDKCFAIMEMERGQHFDPTILDAFFARKTEIIETQIRYAELD